MSITTLLAITLFAPADGYAQSYEQFMQQYGSEQQVPQQPQPQTIQRQVIQNQAAQQQIPQQNYAGGFAQTYPANFNQDYIYGCVNQPIKTPIPISKQLKTDYCACMAEEMKQRMSFQDFRLMDTVTHMRDMQRMPQNVLDGVQAGANNCFMKSGAKMFFGK